MLYKLTVRSVIDYGLTIYFHTLKQTEIFRLNQLQYRAAKLCTGALHFTSQEKLEANLGWESLSTRADFLGLCQFQKFHLHESRPLILNCMPEINFARNTRNKQFYGLFLPLGTNLPNLFFLTSLKFSIILTSTFNVNMIFPLLKKTLKQNLNQEGTSISTGVVSVEMLF